MAATLLRRKGTMRMRGEKEEKSSTERGKKKKQETFTKRGKSVSSAGNMYLMLTAAKLEASVKKRKTRSSGKGGRRAKSTGKRNTKTLTSLPP